MSEYGRVATIGSVEEHTGYDGLYESDSAGFLLALLDSSASVGALRFTREPGAVLPVDAEARVSEAEQSNTSVVFEEQAILKLFRRVSPGSTPTSNSTGCWPAQNNPHVPRLLGSFEMSDDDGPCPLGMVTAHAANSAEGWYMATASTRDLYAEGDLAATRSAATSPESRSGSGQRWPRCTWTWPAPWAPRPRPWRSTTCGNAWPQRRPVFPNSTGTWLR